MSDLPNKFEINANQSRNILSFTGNADNSNWNDII